MSPTASQVHDLCTELKFIGKIVNDRKVDVASRSLQPAHTLWTSFMRMIRLEDNAATIKYVMDKTGRAIEFCDQLQSELHDHDKRNMFRMIREDLDCCIAPDHGLDALHKTYSDKPAPASELEVIIRTIRMKLEKYNTLLPQLPSPQPPPPPPPPQ